MASSIPWTDDIDLMNDPSTASLDLQSYPINDEGDLSPMGDHCHSNPSNVHYSCNSNQVKVGYFLTHSSFAYASITFLTYTDIELEVKNSKSPWRFFLLYHGLISTIKIRKKRPKKIKLVGMTLNHSHSKSFELGPHYSYQSPKCGGEKLVLLFLWCLTYQQQYQYIWPRFQCGIWTLITCLFFNIL